MDSPTFRGHPEPVVSLTGHSSDHSSRIFALNAAQNAPNGIPLNSSSASKFQGSGSTLFETIETHWRVCPSSLEHYDIHHLNQPTHCDSQQSQSQQTDGQKDVTIQQLPASDGKTLQHRTDPKFRTILKYILKPISWDGRTPTMQLLKTSSTRCRSLRTWPSCSSWSPWSA